MDKEWIIDVLGDLRVFAQKNELPLLAGQLNETLAVAKAEIDRRHHGAHLRVVEVDGSATGTVHRKTGTGSDA
ncbi:MAG: hypothetical protein AAGI10_06975 [Pseudomonadota bacterium]